MKTESKDQSPKTIDELVEFISNKVREHFEKSGQRMDGSLLAYTIRSEFPTIDYTKLGLTRLGDAVRIAEKRGLINRHHDVQHLEVSPATTEANKVGAPPLKAQTEKKYVRNDIWRAFLFRSTTNKFISRESYKVIEVDPDKKAESRALAEENEYVQIPRISEEQQIEWARQFVNSTSSNGGCTEEEAKGLINSKEKYKSAGVRAWKAFLSARVVDSIQMWAAKNDLETDQILMPTKSRNELEKFQSGTPDDTAIRKAIIAAVSEMPLADLDNLAIPIKYVRQHFAAK